MELSLTLISTLATPLITLSLGAWIAHKLTTQREQHSARRERAVECLTAAYRELTKPKPLEIEELRQVLNELILFGNQEVARATIRVQEELDDGGTDFVLDWLSARLRLNIRDELGLPNDTELWAPSLRVSFKNEN